MIEILPESQVNILGVKATDYLTNEDYTEVWVPELKRLINQFGRVRALIYLDPNFEGWKLKAMWDDAKFGLTHRNDFEKIAFVGGHQWMKWGVRVCAHLSFGEVKYYKHEELTEAWNWIRK